MDEKSYVIDTSVVVEKGVINLIKSKKISGTIIIPKAVMAELEHQANTGQEIGFLGLEEVQNLQKLNKEEKIKLLFLGDRPNLYQISNAKTGGEVDALIRDIAYSEGSILVTADRIQCESAKALGIEVIYIPHKELQEQLQIEKYFDPETMSVHLREGCPPRGKKGKPGEWKLLEVDKEILTQLRVQEMAKEIVERSRIETDAFIEISRPGSTIVQYKNYRIVITKTPVSDGWEITAVRPIKILKLEDYNIPDKIATRIKTQARGVVIAGTTGSGKSTIAQALAEYYAANNFVTKTIESPRSLILSKEVTQYSKNLASSEEIHDILFLSRPDYIVFDEMRNTPDFELYTDLRLGGSNVLGVLHAATPIDAIQRFISRMDVGMIPSVLDTLIFIDKGKISEIMTVKMIVKVPSGMTEADLARPVVEVRNFNTNKLEFEIYSYGEETIVIPVQEEFLQQDPSKVLAAKHLERELRGYVEDVKVKLISNNKAEVYIPENEIAKFIGKEGKNIMAVEKKLGIGLTVKELSEHENVSSNNEESSDKIAVNYKIEESKKALVFRLAPEYAGRAAEVYVDGHFLLTYTIGNKAELKINKKSKLAQELLKDLNRNRIIEIKV